MKMTASQRLTHLFDGDFEILENVDVTQDPLKFKDIKRYSDKLKDYRAKTGLEDTIVSGVGHVDDVKLVACVHDFSFAGGSLGMAAGEAIIKAFERAIEEKCPLVLFPASGGARMQEGILSLMQLPRTTVAVEMLKEAGLPYIVVLTNPTTGGVSASYAMLGDIHIAEPGAEIGFAGKRVIEQTIREKLPEGFQTSEYLLEHGMVDMVVHRHELPKMLARILRLFANTPAKLEEVLALPAETTHDNEAAETEVSSDEKAPAQDTQAAETDEAKS
jgi:acetyl-CoA carboxylase carboxyl transferase subunit beta